MKRFFSAQTGGFYLEGVNDNVPEDAVEVTEAEHEALVAARAEGMVLVPGTNGRPVPATPLPSPLEEQRTRALGGVKREANRRIEAAVPLWKQSNDNALLALAAVQLAGGATQIDFAPALERRALIDAIRAASDTLEAAIGTMSADDLAALVIADAQHWPA